VGAHALEHLLVFHPEALLLVDHHEAELLELRHRACMQAVGADQDVDLAGGQWRREFSSARLLASGSG
jgi:hypothetical protein